MSDTLGAHIRIFKSAFDKHDFYVIDFKKIKKNGFAYAACLV
ncbi:hypothetical protein [Methylomonas rivi]|uniref:Uncharacterized protein n=1 Tax=Methylomonas rivi TaxID=2952226 RepID=A0ABT1U6X8_9GAMM|nr:hypothetical protein [Methylomonas sp. WSC-6]MCQ8129614.1 hypothetical protein [Methylomonas sp. WSC-6]